MPYTGFKNPVLIPIYCECRGKVAIELRVLFCLLSRICLCMVALVIAQGYDTKQVPSPDTCENHTICWSPLGFCCNCTPSAKRTSLPARLESQLTTEA